MSTILKSARIRYKTHCLGARKDPKTGIRRFFVKDGKVIPLRRYWEEPFLDLAKTLFLPEDLSVSFGDGFRAPQLMLWKRRFNRMRKEEFEIINKGCVITVPFKMSSASPITSQDAEKLWKLVSQFYGLSDFGAKFGFGKFELEELKDINA